MIIYIPRNNAKASIRVSTIALEELLMHEERQDIGSSKS